MDLYTWHLIFKACLIALISFLLPFIFSTLVVVTSNQEVGATTSRKEWMVVFLISFIIMIVILLIFGMSITN